MVSCPFGGAAWFRRFAVAPGQLQPPSRAPRCGEHLLHLRFGSTLVCRYARPIIGARRREASTLRARRREASTLKDAHVLNAPGEVGFRAVVDRRPRTRRSPCRRRGSSRPACRPSLKIRRRLSPTCRPRSAGCRPSPASWGSPGGTGEPLRLSARRFGNAARFVNHASVKPNAEIVRVVHRGLLRVVIVAREAIAAGEQVLVEYGEAYWCASGVEPQSLPQWLADYDVGS
jgi:hypothetical protein